MKALESVSAVLEHIGKPDMTGKIEFNAETVDEVEKVIDEFEAAEKKVHAMIERQCAKAKLERNYDFDRMFEGMVKPTCHGHEMPPDMMEWYGKMEENWTDKTVFCQVPSAAAHLMSKAGDFLMDKAAGTKWTGVGAGMKLMGTPLAGKILRPGMNLSNNYVVLIVSGPFVGVAKPRDKKKKTQVARRR